MDETTMDVVPTEGGEQIAPQSEPSPEGAVQDSPGGESAIEALSQQVKSLSGIVSALQSDRERTDKIYAEKCDCCTGGGSGRTQEGDSRGIPIAASENEWAKRHRPGCD